MILLKESLTTITNTQDIFGYIHKNLSPYRPRSFITLNVDTVFHFFRVDYINDSQTKAVSFSIKIRIAPYLLHRIHESSHPISPVTKSVNNLI